MIQEIIYKHINSAGSIVIDNAEAVAIQDALNWLTDSEAYALWRDMTVPQRQRFFFMAARVNDLATWLETAKRTWIAVLKDELLTSIQEEENRRLSAVDAKAQEIDQKAESIIAAFAHYHALQSANTLLINQVNHLTAERNVLREQLDQQDDQQRAVASLVNAISTLQEIKRRQR